MVPTPLDPEVPVRLDNDYYIDFIELETERVTWLERPFVSSIVYE